MVMQSKDGTLVVIDGGWDSDSAHLLDVIRSKGGHVSGWFITHPPVSYTHLDVYKRQFQE